ncbi:hypothetical protein HanRHA438_Chr04g0201371 [Helianthus annuus]|nr:hypothetical protein HanRHA438_Chr04g0201371 [Helianthus annuus]
MPRDCRNENTLVFVKLNGDGDGFLHQKLPPDRRYLHGDAVSMTSLDEPKLRSNPNEYDRLSRKFLRLKLSSNGFRSLAGD